MKKGSGRPDNVYVPASSTQGQISKSPLHMSVQIIYYEFCAELVRLDGEEQITILVIIITTIIVSIIIIISITIIIITIHVIITIIIINDISSSVVERLLRVRTVTGSIPGRAVENAHETARVNSLGWSWSWK